MKLKRMSRTTVALLLIISILSVALGAVIIYKQVPMTMRVKMSVALGVFDIDAHTPLVSIALGDFLWGDSFLYPGKLPNPTEMTAFYYVNNTDQTEFKAVQFIVTCMHANRRRKLLANYKSYAVNNINACFHVKLSLRQNQWRSSYVRISQVGSANSGDRAKN